MLERNSYAREKEYCYRERALLEIKCYAREKEYC
jgi:hypothetical protein